MEMCKKHGLYSVFCKYCDLDIITKDYSPCREGDVVQVDLSIYLKVAFFDERLEYIQKYVDTQQVTAPKFAEYYQLYKR